jgi:hypothetical protein
MIFAGVQLSFAKIDAATETDDLLALAYSKNDAYSAPVCVGAQLDMMFMFRCKYHGCQSRF